MEDGARIIWRWGDLRCADEDDDCCRIVVADDGPGVPEEIRARIFEPFFSTRHTGTGLGLPIARRVVEQHGGSIDVACPESGGTTVTIRLPLHQR